MRMGQGVRTGLGHGGITCVLQTQFSSFIMRHLQSSCFDFKALAENMKNSRLLGLFWTGKTLSSGVNLN